MRSSTTVVYCAVDDLVPPSGKPLTGFAEFLEALTAASVPCVWVTSRNRLQLDAALRKLGHAAPFIAEGGSGAYIPEDYFHLKPARTTRLGRFICVPVAALQPAASDVLELVAAETGVAVVPLRTLSPRELTQNTGLPPREAESLQQRDFDELFFFAGASDGDIQKFRAEAERQNAVLRPRGALWSLAVHPDLAVCVRELSKLYDRAMRARAFTIGIATALDAADLFPACQRSILLTEGNDSAESASLPRTTRAVRLFSPEAWPTILEAIRSRSL